MLEDRIIRRTLRVPAPPCDPGDGSVVARQLDAVLLGVGFACSRELLEHLAGLRPGAAIDAAVRVLGAVRALVGDHVEHNTYFRDFPAGVPETEAFWVGCLLEALADPEVAAEVTAAGGLNLLALPGYGRYRHSYAEMLAAREELVASAKDRVTVLHLGRPLDDEAYALYRELAASTVPLGDADRALLEILAAWCVDRAAPDDVPVRENLAVLNRVRLAHDRPVLLDTVTDVLRLACALSGGDVSLAEPTRFRSMPRPLRRRLLAALDAVVARSPAALGDVNRFRERWKRLGERLHPHQYPDLPRAQDVFAVARGEHRVRSTAGRIEVALAAGDVRAALRVVSGAPGMLFRGVDRLLRAAADQAERDAVLEAMERHADRVSGRVLLGLREHLANRVAPDPVRVFVNQGARAWVTDDRRAPLDPDLVRRATAVLDEAVARRLPRRERVVVDPAVLSLALPLSGKATASGLAVMPRGSVVPVDGDRLRFFLHWREAHRRTDYDLSALLLDDDFTYQGHLSYTNLKAVGGVHSGDLTSAPDGASEFIEIDLSTVPARYVVPQVNVYAGEGFEEVAESFFGFMTRDGEQHGRPFEPRTVRMRSDLRGTGRVALPLVFARDATGAWSATWLNLFLNGRVDFNQVEANRVSSAVLARSVLGRRFVTVGDLVTLMGDAEPHTGQRLDGPVTYIGIERPDGLPDGSEVITLDRLAALVPA